MNKDYAMSIRNKLKNHDEIMVPSAAVIPIFKDKILLQKRSDTKTWGIIGGGIQYNEKIKETALRELHEETNLEAKNLRQFGIYSLYPIKYLNGDKVNAFTVAFICNLKNKDNVIYNDRETEELAWFSLEQINGITFWNKTAKEIALDAFLFMKSKEQILK